MRSSNETRGYPGTRFEGNELVLDSSILISQKLFKNRLFFYIVALTSLLSIPSLLMVPDALADSYYGNGSAAAEVNQAATSDHRRAVIDANGAACAKYQRANNTGACSAEEQERNSRNGGFDQVLKYP